MIVGDVGLGSDDRGGNGGNVGEKGKEGDRKLKAN